VLLKKSMGSKRAPYVNELEGETVELYVWQ
jgi:hypothetical protein